MSRIYKKENLIGKKFGKWTVLEQFEDRYPSGNKKYMTKCKCDCGVTKPVIQLSLKNGRSKSCGCDKDFYKRMQGKNSNLFKGHGDISAKFWGTTKRKAERRNIDFSISIEEAWEIFLSQDRKCKLSGIDLHFGKVKVKAIASLDRINSNKAYTIDNVQWVHKHINIMKNIYSQDYFVSLCKKVSSYS